MESKSSNSTSIKYHQIFDFKLTKDELFRWQFKNEKVVAKGLKDKQSLLLRSKKRIEREKYSEKKLKIAKNAANLISKIPSVLFIGITGSLAMMNAKKDSDIDLMIITKQNTLWITRLLIYLLLKVANFELRDPKLMTEKDKLCLNMWLDETALMWNKNDRNIYTAHEIAQVVPLVNKNKTFEKFLYLNKWVLNYWPKSVRIRRHKEKVISLDSSLASSILFILEHVVYKFQYWYMSKKITREIVTPTRAIFHPNDWGSVVLKKLSSVK